MEEEEEEEMNEREVCREKQGVMEAQEMINQKQDMTAPC